jgi:hypothetical protein
LCCVEPLLFLWVEILLGSRLVVVDGEIWHLRDELHYFLQFDVFDLNDIHYFYKLSDHLSK